MTHKSLFLQFFYSPKLVKIQKSCDKSEAYSRIILTPKMNMTHRARGCPFITNVDGEDFVIDGFAKYDGYGDECKELYFAGVSDKLETLSLP